VDEPGTWHVLDRDSGVLEPGGVGGALVRLGDDIGVSADKAHIYLYAGTDKAAGEAEQAAREALALDGRVAESSLLERWDPDGQKWRDPRVEIPDDDQQPAQRSGGPSCSAASSRS
jgi:hypothetical protein